MQICLYTKGVDYGVATIGRLLECVGLFCRIQPLLQGSFAKETYNFKEHTNRSHPICRKRVESVGTKTVIVMSHM